MFHTVLQAGKRGFRGGSPFGGWGGRLCQKYWKDMVYVV